jgi:uncharacterized repeat protein (TIGR01451 family)
MKRPVFALCAGMLLLGLLPGFAQATADVQDASNGSAGSTAVNDGVTAYGETFKALNTGTVDEVDLYVSCSSSGNVDVGIVRTTGSPAIPDAADPLASSNHLFVSGGAAWVSFHPSYAITAGNEYAVTFSFPSQCDAYATVGTYADGQAVEGSGLSWSTPPVGTLPANSDFAFSVLVVPAASPPAISAAFAAPSMTVGQAVALTFTIANGVGDGHISNVGFSETLPTGLSVTNGSASACGGGTLTRTSPSGITLSGGSLADGASCQASAMVTGNAAGSYTTTSGAVSSTEKGAGNTATASINVDAFPSIAAAFNSNSVAVGATTQLTITITNPAGNPETLRVIDLADTLPAGLTVASAKAVTTCGAGSLTVTAPNSIALYAASVAVGSPCVFAVPVTAGVAGTYTDIVTARLGGWDYTGNTASAGLGVAAAAPTPTPTPTKAPTPPPTTIGVGPGSDNTGGAIWFLPLGLLASIGGLLVLVDRRRRRLI